MTSPSISQLNFYTNKRLTDKDWSKNFTQIVTWLTGGYDLVASSVTTTGDITSGGKITAGTGFYGDGSNLTGVGGGGSSAGVGISQVEQLTESSKLFRMQIPTSLTNIISEPLIDGANFTGTLTSTLAAGATTIAITPTITGEEPPHRNILTIVRAADGVSEEIQISGGSAGTYTLSSSIQTVGGFATSDAVYRNFCTLNVAGANATILSGQAGDARQVQNHIGGQIDVGARTNGVIDWSVRMNSLTQGLVVDSIAAAPTNIIYLQSATDRTGEFSASAPYNKLILNQVTENGQKGLYQTGKGREYTIVTVGAHSSSKIPITVSDTYNDMDAENAVATGGVTGLSAISADGLTYWVACYKTAIPKISFVATGVNESFVEVVPKKATVFNQGMSYPSYVHSHWKMDEITGNALNSRQTSGTYNLTQSGTVPSATGKINQARGPFSTSNYFTWGAGGSSTTIYDVQTFLLEAWFKTSATGVLQWIIGKNNYSATQGMALGIYSDNKVILRIANSDIFSSATYTDGNWHYAVGARIGAGTNDTRLYIDGSLITQGTRAAFTNSTNDLTVGALKEGTAYHIFQGLLDSVAFWSTVPTTWAEIEAIIAQRYAGGRGREYGSQFGLSISGTESNKTGQLATLRADIVQASLTATIPTIEAKNLIVSGGL